MPVQQQTELITGDEYVREWHRLHSARVPFEDPEFQRLWRRLVERDEALVRRFAMPYFDTHPDKWAAVSEAGQVLIRDAPWEAARDATEQFGEGRFAIRQLSENGGHRMLSPLR